MMIKDRNTFTALQQCRSSHKRYSVNEYVNIQEHLLGQQSRNYYIALNLGKLSRDLVTVSRHRNKLMVSKLTTASSSILQKLQGTQMAHVFTRNWLFYLTQWERLLLPTILTEIVCVCVCVHVCVYVYTSVHLCSWAPKHNMDSRCVVPENSYLGK